MAKKQRKSQKNNREKKPSVSTTNTSTTGIHWLFAIVAPIAAIAVSLLYSTSKQTPSSIHDDLSSYNNISEGPLKSGSILHQQNSFSGDGVDKNLFPMNFTFSGDEEMTTFMAYVTPDVSTFYRNNDDDQQDDEMTKKSLMKPKFNGLAGKFFNLSPHPLTLYWDDKRDGLYIGDAAPFETVGTATFPGHRFFYAKKNDPSDIKHHFKVISGQNNYIYDAIASGGIDSLSKDERKKYLLQKRNLEFAAEYKKFTSREWLSLYPKRPPPMHNMWPADYFSQTHWVMTNEAHFDQLPPSELLNPINKNDMYLESKRRREEKSKGNDPGAVLQDYRSSPTLNMTISVISCAPRVFEIKNFLSPIEVDHIVHMATGMNLQVSTVSGHDGNKRTTSNTRTSRNSWVSRSKSPIIDSIYRRAADLMMIDEALLRVRVDGTDERSDVPYKATASEDLQLVHYDKTQEYTAHHDFSQPKLLTKDQPVRFATLLLYLNDDMQGGETSFPRWMNAETNAELKVTPESGKAVLFYSLLPDGNMDDLSQHAAKPVIDGEKWLINLWTWDKKFR